MKANVLMDESRCNRRFFRRLALMAVIQCTAVPAIIPSSTFSCLADDPKQANADEVSLRALLHNGWSEEQRLKTKQAPESTQWKTLERVHKAPQTKTKRRPENLSTVAPHELNAALKTSLTPVLVPLRIEAVKAIQIQPSKQGHIVPSIDVAKRMLSRSDESDKRDSAQLPNLPQPMGADLDSVDMLIQEQRREALSRIALDQGFTLLNPERTDFAKNSEVQPSSKAKSKSQFEMPLMASKPKPRKSVLARPISRPSELSTVHAAKLREVAQLNLREASDRLRRGATFSAKRLTLKALNNIVQMRDLQDGGNEHAKQFQSGLTAIRESRDFRDELGSVNQKAIKRFVAIHSTGALKDRDLAAVTTLHAMECYLLEAQEQLTNSVQGVTAASQALTLLGQIERTMGDVSNTHSAATALTLQKAAVAIDPNNVVAQYELGENLYSQGLHEQAFDALSVCVAKRPDRRSYQLLMQTAKRLGDRTTASDCMVALRNPKLPSTTPVRRLKSSDFASTYRPANDVARNSTSTNANEKKKLEAQPVSSKTKIGSKWRGWISDKFR